MKRFLDFPSVVKFGAPARARRRGEATFRVHFFAPGSMLEAAVCGLHAQDLAHATKRISEALKPGWTAEVWSQDGKTFQARLSRKH